MARQATSQVASRSGATRNAQGASLTAKDRSKPVRLRDCFNQVVDCSGALVQVFLFSAFATSLDHYRIITEPTATNERRPKKEKHANASNVTNSRNEGVDIPAPFYSLCALCYVGILDVENLLCALRCQSSR